MSDTLTPSGLQSSAGLYGQCGIYQFDRNGAIFNPLDLNPYLLFDAETSMIGTLENPTLDLDPTKQESLDVITATRAGTATFVNLDGEIEIAQPNTVRVDSSLGYPAILVEPSATNSFLYSQPTSALAFGGGGIRTFDAATAPNGETEAFRITNNGTSGNDNYRATSSITFGSDSMVLSVWAKAGSGGNNYFTWSFQNLGGTVVRAGFKLEGDGETQIITNGNGGHTLQIETYPDGWYRCIIIGNTQSSGTTSQFLYTVSGYTEHSSIAGGSVLLWGFQVESGSVATSYIPTSGSTVQRAADNLEISGSDFDFYNASEGTTYMEVVPEPSASKSILFEYMDESAGADEIMGSYLTSGTSYFYAITSGSFVANTSLGTTTNLSELNRIAVSYKVNDMFGSINGATSFRYTSLALPTGIDKLAIGNDNSGNLSITGRIRRLIYWPVSSERL
jgi:hypothetical protein